MSVTEVLEELALRFRDATGRGYGVRVRGHQGADGFWDAWLEFVPEDGGPVRRTEHDTRQRSREDLTFWASGLEPTYLEGAFERARPA
jgi:hypothetical protein